MRADRIVAAIGLSVASCRFGDWHQTEPPPRGRRGARSTANGPRDHRPLLRLPAPETGRLPRRHRGTHTDGHRYVETALRDGAVAAVVQRRAGTAWPQVVVPDTRRALALMSSTLYGRPSADMVVIGVTGTDGKTTTTTMIHQMLLSAGRRVGS